MCRAGLVAAFVLSVLSASAQTPEASPAGRLPWGWRWALVPRVVGVEAGGRVWPFPGGILRFQIGDDRRARFALGRDVDLAEPAEAARLLQIRVEDRVGRRLQLRRLGGAGSPAFVEYEIDGGLVDGTELRVGVAAADFASLAAGPVPRGALPPPVIGEPFDSESFVRDGQAVSSRRDPAVVRLILLGSSGNGDSKARRSRLEALAGRYEAQGLAVLELRLDSPGAPARSEEDDDLDWPLVRVPLDQAVDAGLVEDHEAAATPRFLVVGRDGRLQSAVGEEDVAAALKEAQLGPAAFAEVGRAMASARQAGDEEGLARQLARAFRLRPQDPALLARRAALRAQGGGIAGASRDLACIAGQGAAVDPALAGSLAAEPSLRAALERIEFRIGACGRAEALPVEGREGRHPEGLAFDPVTGCFLVGDSELASILAIDAKGRTSERLQAPPVAMGGIGGLVLDVARRRIWVSAQRKTTGTERRSGLWAFDADSGACIFDLPLEAGGSGDSWLGDLALRESDGTVIGSEGLGGRIVLWRPGSEALEILVPAGRLYSPQGLAFEDGGRTALVADYRMGLHRLDLETGRLDRIEASADLSVHGIDGLVLEGRTLHAVRNGVLPHRLERLVLSADGRSILSSEAILQGDPRFDEPNHVIRRGGDLVLIAGGRGRAPGPVLLALPVPP